MSKRLYRSRENKMLFGVLGGIAEYLGTDPTLVRVLFVLLLLAMPGTAILLYFILAIVMPESPEEEVTLEKLPEKVDKLLKEADETLSNVGKRAPDEIERAQKEVIREDDRRVLAAIIIIIGLAIMVGNMNLLLPAWFSFKLVVAAVFVLFGLYLLVRG
ncbi:PspC domain-containing protein [Palaeococcus ferrophilus]|uniref:PspC domain-containing protein n=1 Tax=Palaeococcus ferrophilus TaxID=83868 RepID=UPI00064FF4B2|nr:PspC domain-containing protein [Palaeococcus ferrophilus]